MEGRTYAFFCWSETGFNINQVYRGLATAKNELEILILQSTPLEWLGLEKTYETPLSYFRQCRGLVPRPLVCFPKLHPFQTPT